MSTPETSQSWTKYIIAPSSRLHTPKAILCTAGDVTNPSGTLHGTPTTLTRTKPSSAIPSITYDFGLNIVGFPRVIFAGASDNRPGVRLAFSETRAHLSERSDFTRSDYQGEWRTGGTDNFVVPKDRFVWNDKRSCLLDGDGGVGGNKVCSDGLHGFRYVKISLDVLEGDEELAAKEGWVTLESVAVVLTGYLGTADTYGGWFECDDERLNRYWYQGSYTNEMTIDTFRSDDTEPRDADSETLRGKLVIFDGAKRDRDPYVGDIAVSGRTTYLTHPDAAVAVRNSLADVALHQREDGYIPPASILNYGLRLFDYTLWWISTSYDYVMYTGDIEYVREYWRVIVKALDGWCLSKTDSKGLLSRGEKTGTGRGWGDYAFLGRDGAVTYYNALYVRVLKEAAAIARIIDGQEHKLYATAWENRAERVARIVDERNWDAAVGAYLDSPTNSSTRHAQDGNAMAVLAGVANEERARAALTYLQTATSLPYGNAFMDDTSLAADANERVYAFISYFDLEARFQAGLGESAIEQIQRLYGWMNEHDPASTHWEGIGRGGGQYGGGQTSCAHGWSTGIVPLMVNRVLGVTPTAPGFKEWEVKPWTESMAWAKGVVPTVYGRLFVRWERQGARITIKVRSPEGTKGRVVMPDTGDGVAQAFMEINAGEHSFTNY